MDFDMIDIELQTPSLGADPPLCSLHDNNTNVDQSEEAFKDVISVLKPLKEDFVKFPKSVSEKQSVIAGFDKISKIKNIIGGIDGTHYCMQKPTTNAKDYWRRYSRYDVACRRCATLSADSFILPAFTQVQCMMRGFVGSPI